jgi:hypothetical protein
MVPFFCDIHARIIAAEWSKSECEIASCSWNEIGLWVTAFEDWEDVFAWLQKSYHEINNEKYICVWTLYQKEKQFFLYLCIIENSKPSGVFTVLFINLVLKSCFSSNSMFKFMINLLKTIKEKQN